MAAETNPRIDPRRAEELARQHYGLEGTATDLPSYIDQNFLLRGAAGTYVVKFAHADERRANLDLENQMMQRIAASDAPCTCPRVLQSLAGEPIVEVGQGVGAGRFLRVVSFLEGALLADARPYAPGVMRSLGRSIGAMDEALAGFEHPAMDRELRWDLAWAGGVASQLGAVEDPELGRIVAHFLLQFLAQVGTQIPDLRRSVIHNDVNDLNVLIAKGDRIGVIDFGDAVQTCTVFNLAIAAAYAVFDADDPVATLCELVAGYHETFPLQERELAVLFPSVCMRLCVTLVLAACDGAERPDNTYITVSQRPAIAMLRRFWDTDPVEVLDRLRAACGFAPLDPGAAGRAPEALRAGRAQALGPSLSLSYAQPLTIVRGRGQYLFDPRGRGYLDCVNNVCHVGHCHPRVVAAAQSQIATLNTNTRYLHDNLVEYAERLAGLFPDPLKVCFFVNSGSEANELAMRLARAHTGREDMVVIDVGYHGNTLGLVELSPYKHAGPGGGGRPEHVHVAELPCGFGGPHRYGTPDLGALYARSVADALQRAAQRGGAAAFFAESISGCGGQVEFPAGYLAAAYEHARHAGALCVADEVQVGFGRVGSHMWAFEAQGVVPDIVTLGKPIGNGHPMAAVVTRAEIAASFDNGMEYFNTFGGNPVSCATGLAVLDVLEDEGLLRNAAQVGAYLKDALQGLQARFPILADVRGRGLFLGVEMVRDLQTGEPAAEELAELVERMKEAGVLLSTDGRAHNVLKFKPPMPFSRADADLLLHNLQRVLVEMGLGPRPTAGPD